MSEEEPTKIQSEIILSRRMFYAGCLGLPWLWICNIMYFRRKVFGPSLMFDYWPGKRDEFLNALNEGESNERDVPTLHEKNELEKWVKRSTRGAIVVVSVFLAWIVTFQVNKENFGSGWFVMDMSEDENSDW
jgi:hypothetical protein